MYVAASARASVVDVVLFPADRPAENDVEAATPELKDVVQELFSVR